MRVVQNLNRFKKHPTQRLILAIGNFDGFHLGHQKLLAYVVKQAQKYHALAAVMTFRQHPQSVLHPEKKQMLLYALEQKLFHLAEAGIDICFLPSFTRALSRTTPEQFVEDFLVKKLHILEVCMGYDAHFGRGRKGTTALMQRFARRDGFLFRKMEPVKLGKRPVSSSLIRMLLSAGKIEKVNACLGRPFSLFGKVVKGKGHGTHLGFPTINLEVHSNIQIPLGVYVATACLLDKKKRDRYPVRRMMPRFCGVMNFGRRPTYPARETPKPVLEVHLFNFSGNLYGRNMEVTLHKFLRPEKRFSNEEQLKKQISRDTEAARKYHLQHNRGFCECPAVKGK